MPNLTTYKGVSRLIRIPSCELSAEDLRKLAAKLEEFAHEAAEREVGQLRQLDGQTQEQLEQVRIDIRDLMRLRVQVQEDSGEWRSGEAGDVLSDAALPDVVDQVIFDTAYDLRLRTNRVPLNGISLTLDFRRRPVFDLSNAADAARSNTSGGLVQGSDTIWADGVHHKLKAFFQERRSLWRWLHLTYAYDVLLMAIGFPLTFGWVNRVDTWTSTGSTTLSPVVHVGVLVYLVLLLLYAFRLMFNYACHILPRVKGPRSGTGGGFRAGLWLVLQVLAWLSWLILDVVTGTHGKGLGR